MFSAVQYVVPLFVDLLTPTIKLAPVGAVSSVKNPLLNVVAEPTAPSYSIVFSYCVPAI